MDQDNTYPVGGSQYGLDPASLNDPQWPMYQPQYGQQNEQFAPPHSGPSSALTSLTYQPYSDPQSSYGNYGIPQDSMYQVPAYSSGYAPPYQQSNLLHPYVTTQHSTVQAQAPPHIQQSFQSSNQPYPYTQMFREDDRTISPHVLERVDNIPPSQRSSQTWNQGVAAGYERQNAIVSTGANTQQSRSHPKLGEYSLTSVSGVDDSVRHVGISSQIRDIQRSGPSRKGTTILPQSTLRITHPELLAATQNMPSRRISSAPYVVLDEEPVALEGGVKAKTTVSKPVKDNSKRSVETGSENSATLIAPATISAKSRARPSKSGPSTGLAKSATKPKLLTSTREKSPQSSASSDEESASENESSSDEQSVEPDMLEQISDVRGEMRPTDVVEAAAWDAIGTVFSPKYRNTTTDEIIKGAQEFGKYFLNLRDELVSISTDLAKAEADKRLEDAKQLRDARALKRRVIASAVQATIKFGKGIILNNFGKNPRLINGLIHVLRDCVKFKDLDGELPRAVLNLLSRCGFITDELLQKAKFEPLEKRLLMNNDAEIKGYIKTIRTNTLDAKERAKAVEQAAKAEDSKVRLAGQEAVRARKTEDAPRTASNPTSNPTSLKRTLESDANNGKPSKKIASEATAVGSSQRPIAPKARVASFLNNLKRPSLKSQVPPKVATTPASAKKPETKPKPTSTPQSSVAELLASIEKPRELPKAPEAPPRPPESPEEKARRERKESRRHLRVHWKDGNALTEIRLFKHELAEDEGRQDNMLRDAHDDRSEGMMLKQRVLENMADEEDDGAGEVEYIPYPELSLIDFSELKNDIREKSYVTRGGRLTFSTPQQQIQDRRESLELMVVYTDPKDIPSSPKEPPPQTTHEKAPAERIFGQPSATWLVQRVQEVYQYGPAVALSIFVRRLEGQKGRTIYQDIARGSKTVPDISSILNAMKALPQEQNSAGDQLAYQQYMANQQSGIQNFTSSHKHQGPHPQLQLNTGTSVRSEQQLKMSNDVFANLARMTDHLRGKPYPPTEPPEWMTERAKAEWWEGYYRDNQTPAKLRAVSTEISVHQARLRAAEAQTPQATAAQMQYPQMGSYAVPAPQNMATGSTPSYDVGQLQQVLAGLNSAGNNAIPPQLQNIFTSLNAQSNQAVPQQQQIWSGTPSGGNNSGQSYPSMSQPSRWVNSFPNATEISFSVHNENSRSTHDTLNQDSVNHRTKDGGYGGYGGEDRLRVATAASEYKGKKKPCKFWQEGKCAKGANCTFLHD